MAFHGYVAIQARGVVALPAELRRKLHLDAPGTQMEVTERDDGVLELRPSIPVPADQAWFWTERWQRREREVDAYLEAGDVATDQTTDGFLAALDRLADDADQ
jgi:AbrB family looped-hinge helix DNA binding protein